MKVENTENISENTSGRGAPRGRLKARRSFLRVAAEAESWRALPDAVRAWAVKDTARLERAARALGPARGHSIVRDANDAVGWLVPMLAGHPDERIVLLVLDTGCRVISAEVVAMGGVDHCVLDRRAILRRVLEAGGTRFVLGHNHPSGDPEPSVDDVAVTRRLRAAAETVGVELLDHIVIGSMDYCSMAARGQLGPATTAPTAPWCA